MPRITVVQLGFILSELSCYYTVWLGCGKKTIWFSMQSGCTVAYKVLWFGWDCPPQTHVFDPLVPIWWECLGKSRRCGFAEGSASLDAPKGRGGLWSFKALLCSQDLPPLCACGSDCEHSTFFCSCQTCWLLLWLPAMTDFYPMES